MSIEVKIPSVGESVTEVTLASWLKSDGDYVEEGEPIAEIESDKATVELPAESSGVLKIKVEEGEDLEIGAVIAELDTEASAPASEDKEESSKKSETEDKSKEEASEDNSSASSEESAGDKNYPSPAAKKILEEKGLSADDVKGTGKDGRITKADAEAAKAPEKKAAAKESKPSKAESSSKPAPQGQFSRNSNREKMTRLRKTIAKRLVEAKNNTAMLTTFNEIDMSQVMKVRKQYKEQFKEKYETNLGFMSFFTKACTLALREVPAVNAQIDGEEIVYHDYADVGIAVSTPKGLMVPVVRNAESLSMANIEREIIRLAKKGRDGKISMEEMEGGTFTITNGGIFGSMLSTPIINTPQSAILGMHNIVERPIAVNGQVEIRPVMYVALSYDHRLIDGKESVTFLYKVKELIEDPTRLLLEI